MKICVLGSGSRGNSIYIESHGAAIIIDQGFSHREIKKRLDSRGLDEKKIKCILVTHEHDDHIRGVGVTARKLGIPVYGTSGSLNGRKNIFNGGEDVIIIESGVEFTLGPFKILPYSVPHDAVDPVQFCVKSGKKKITVATDLGFVSTLVDQCLRDSDLVVIEANHDVDMLMKGSYSWELKQRIMSRTGHLSNQNAAEILFNISTENSGLKAILAHLSEDNNSIELAEKKVFEIFENFERRLKQLIIATQNEATPVLEV